MGKIIIAFAAGQLVQIVLLMLGEGITYLSNLTAFCASIGAAALVMLCVGVYGARVEFAYRENDNREGLKVAVPDSEDEIAVTRLFGHKADMEETAPIPEEFAVTNDSIKRVEYEREEQKEKTDV